MKLSDKTKELLRQNFVRALIRFSGDKISFEEANRITDEKLNGWQKGQSTK